MSKLQGQTNSVSSEKSEKEIRISVKSLVSPLYSFVRRLIATVFKRLTVVVLFGFGGLLVGAVIGLPTGPWMALTAAVGGAIGLLIGGVWEFRRLKNGIEYDELLD